MRGSICSNCVACLTQRLTPFYSTCVQVQEVAQGLAASSASAQRGGTHATDRDGGRRRYSHSKYRRQAAHGGDGTLALTPTRTRTRTLSLAPSLALTLTLTPTPSQAAHGGDGLLCTARGQSPPCTATRAGTATTTTTHCATTHRASTHRATTHYSPCLHLRCYSLLTTNYLLREQGASPLKLGSGEGRSWGDRAPEDEGGNEPPRFETLTLALTRSNPTPNPNPNPTQVTSHRASRRARSSLPITAHSSLPSPPTSLGWAARTRRLVCNTGRTLPLTLTPTLTLELAGPR